MQNFYLKVVNNLVLVFSAYNATVKNKSSSKKDQIILTQFSQQKLLYVLSFGR